MTALPASVLMSMEMLRLLRLKTGNSADPKPTLARVRSPSGGSTLMTSAPRSASTMLHDGPITVWPNSSTRMPESGSPSAAACFVAVVIVFSSFGSMHAFAQFLEAAAELHRAGQRMPDDLLGGDF